LQAGLGPQRLGGELAPVHAGHDHIGQKQIDVGFSISEDLKRCVCIVDGDHSVPKACQNVSDICTKVAVILHDKDGLRLLAFKEETFIFVRFLSRRTMQAGQI
jgi:hypothetical protein